MRRLKGIALFSFILFFTCLSSASNQSIEITELKKRESEERRSQDVSKFSQWGDNEILFRYTDLRGTKRHADVSLGFRYLITDTQLPKGKDSEYAVALAYQGEFDFFAFTRDSSPVVTTRHNPSIFYTRMWNPSNGGLTSWFLSFEHESNGQVTDSQSDYNLLIRNFSSQYSGNGIVTDDEIYEMTEQTISRSSNFFGFGINYTMAESLTSNGCKEVLDCVHILAKFRTQIGDVEDEIWWTEGRFEELKKYTGTQVDIEAPFELLDVKNSVRLTFTTGQVVDGSFFSNITADIRYYIDLPVGRYISKVTNLKNSEFFTVPLVIRYHNGYADELYNYHKKTSYLAIGLHARY